MPSVNVVARPVALTVATVAFDVLHVAELVSSFVLPSLKLPVAEYCSVLPAIIDASLGPTLIDCNVGGGLTVTIVLPDLLVSWADVAVTVTVPAVAGAVNIPEELIVPVLADHVTDELKLPVPETVAVHCKVCPVCTEVEIQETETEVMVGAAGVEAVLEPPPPPPQDVVASVAKASVRAIGGRRRSLEVRYTSVLMTPSKLPASIFHPGVVQPGFPF